MFPFAAPLQGLQDAVVAQAVGQDAVDAENHIGVGAGDQSHLGQALLAPSKLLEQRLRLGFDALRPQGGFLKLQPASAQHQGLPVQCCAQQRVQLGEALEGFHQAGVFYLGRGIFVDKTSLAEPAVLGLSPPQVGLLHGVEGDPFLHGCPLTPASVPGSGAGGRWCCSQTAPGRSG